MPAHTSLRVHTWLSGGDRHQGGFGLHVWGPGAAAPTQWDAPLGQAGQDAFGPYFDVQLSGAPGAEQPYLGLLLHRGEEKKITLEVHTEADLHSKAPGGEIWLGHAEQPASSAPATVPLGDLHHGSFRAHWLSERLIAWRAAGAAPPGSTFFLHASAQAQLEDAGAAGVQGGDHYAVELALAGSELTPELEGAHPYLKGCALLRVPDSADPRQLCRCQLVASARAPGGEMLDCTGVQVGALLDDLFAYAGSLGCNPTDGSTPQSGVTLALWAPTAQIVEVVLYDDALGAAKETLAMERGTVSGQDGLWKLSGPETWWGCYYAYRVTAYHPKTSSIVVMDVPDPYSKASSADAGRTCACHLPAWEEAAPGGSRAAWLKHERPAFGARADAVIYELHVRDFSMSDPTVPEAVRGKYLAFEQQGTRGDLHLRKLAAAGITHVQLLPTYDFGTVPERAEDRSEQQIPADCPADSEAQQAAAMAVQDRDGFNWGYDPVLYDVPEGSYASHPDGAARVKEHRAMVAALHAKGLRVVLDVVYNHTLGSGPVGKDSVLDKCVPGYYHRRAEDGAYEASTCMNNTAAERAMMERLVVESMVHWVREYRVDGFRMDLMGHMPLRCIKKCRAALDALTVAQDGIDGPTILLYGEGWEFGEIAGSQRGVAAVQQQLAGSGVGSFNDRVRDAALGGSPFADPRVQGFATGLFLRPWPDSAGVDQGDAGRQRDQVLVAADKLRLSLVGSLREYALAEDMGGNRDVLGGQVHGGGVAYTACPTEVINYVSAHDNETLYDNTVWKMPASLFSPAERMRANWLSTAMIALSHGLPFFHAGDELLRSKSLDRDSYNSGDWFNVLDFAGEVSGFGRGLPVRSKNGEKWDLIRPLLGDASLRPTKEMVLASTEKFCELVRIRGSTGLIGLADARDIKEKVRFPLCGREQVPGLIVMETRNGRSASDASRTLCDSFARVVVVFSARLEETRVRVPPGADGTGALPMELHPLQAASGDELTRSAFVDVAAGELVVPPQTASVFVERLP